MTACSRRAVIAACLTLPALAAHAAPRPTEAFSQVAQAIGARHALRFVARQDIVLLPPPGPAPAPGLMQIVTDVTRDRGRVRMVYWLPCDATNRIIVDDGVEFRQWEPARRVILVDRSHEESAATGQRMLALLHRNYLCALLRRESVNGLMCDVVAVRPRHLPAPSRLLWIERSRHAILRTEEQDAAGQRRYLSFYETFRFVPRVSAGTFSLPPAPLRPAPRPMRDVGSVRAAFTGAGVAGRLPAWLPEGFVLVGSAVTVGERSSALLRYGDGLKTISVFEEASRPGDDLADRQESLRKDMARYGQQAWVCGDPKLCITVLGDAALPDSLGQDLLRAFDPESEARLARGLARDFGDLSGAERLRRRGWDYTQIVALRLYGRVRPDQMAAAAARLQLGQDWPQVAGGLRADPAPLEAAARRWIADTLTVRPIPNH